MEVYSFNFNDHHLWLQHLREHGYVVVKNVVSPEEVDTAKSLVWKWLENLGSGIRRDDVSTWGNANWPGSTFLGFMTTYGGGHIEAAWFLRGLKSVREVFGKIYSTNELLTSMDTFIMWRPWWKNPIEDEEWMPIVERIHCDQNPVKKRGFHCVQGMIPLLHVTKETGGLQVVPDTHTDEIQDYLIQNYPSTKLGGDWCQLRIDDKYINRGKLLLADPGDVILWDSRLLHGGLVGTGKKENHPNTDLARLSLTVCMAPASKATPQVLENRRMAFKYGWTLTHWPYEFNVNDMGNTNGSNIKNGKYVPPVLNEEQFKLVG